MPCHSDGGVLLRHDKRWETTVLPCTVSITAIISLGFNSSKIACTCSDSREISMATLIVESARKSNADAEKPQ